jgi:hypothetical protein
MWSRRTMAIGTLCKLLGKDAADFEIMRAHDTGNPRDWMWAVDVNPQMANMGNNQADGNAVRAFFAFWKEHHAEYGVKEEPSNAGLPTVRRGGMGGKQVRPIPVDGPVQILPVPGDAPATPYIAPEPPVRGRAAG